MANKITITTINVHDQMNKPYTNINQLQLDDSSNVMHEIIEERYECTTTIITSNLEPAEWVEAFNNKLLGVATIDRLLHNAIRLKLDGKSYRTGKKQQ